MKTNFLLQLLRPSGAKRWTVCRASVGMHAALLEIAEKAEQEAIEELKLLGQHEAEAVEVEVIQDSSDYADEGTLAHKLASDSLIARTWAPDKKKYDKEMIDYVHGYYKLVMDHFEDADVSGVEFKVPRYYIPIPPLEQTDDECSTTDAFAVHKDGAKLTIIDLKYGAGVSIPAKLNKQLAIYAKGVILKYADVYNFTEKTLITLIVYQPRFEGEKPIRVWALSLGELNEFLNKEVTVHTEAILTNPDAQPFNPSDETCQFCPVSTVCQARTAWLLGELPLDGKTTDERTLELMEKKEGDFVEPRNLSTEQVARLVLARPAIVRFLNDCEELVKDLLLDGKQVHIDGKPAFKLVSGKTHRKWSDEEEARKFLRSMLPAEICIEEHVISPAKAEAIMEKRRTRAKSWERFKELVVKPSGKPTLALESDPRPSIAPMDLKDEFEVIPAEANPISEATKDNPESLL
jgi:hypothetical protein